MTRKTTAPVRSQKSAQPGNEGYTLEEQVGFMLRVSGQRHSLIFQSHVPDSLTAMQFSALVKVLQLGQCSQNELGRKTAMDVATIKGVIDRLRARGLVMVKPDPTDKRRSLIVGTDKAEALKEELFSAGHKITRDTLSPLSAAERKTFLSLLARLT